MHTVIPECHFDEKAMPSAGLIPMLQSYVCGLNNTCRASSTDSRSGTVNMYHNATFSRTFLALDRILRQPSPQELDKGLSTLLSLFKETQAADISSNAGRLRFVGKFLCGSEDVTFDITDRSLGLKTDFSKILQQFIPATDTAPEQSNTANFNGYWWMPKNRSEISNDYCQTMFKGLENSSNTDLRILWKPLKSFVLGKLLYSPDTPVTRKLAKRMNITFETLDGLIWAGKEFAKALPEVQKVLVLIAQQNSTAEALDMLTQLSDGFTAKFQAPLNVLIENLLQTPTGGLVSSGKRAIIQVLLDQLDTFGGLLGNITRILSCLDLDKFVALENEEALGVKGAELVSNGTLWAGIVFDGLYQFDDDENLSKPIRYKIRYDVDKVDPTNGVKSSFWEPNPRRDPIAHLKYTTFGFNHLQDIIERALMGKILRKFTTDSFPGVYLQQFPYPSYTEDNFTMTLSGIFPLVMTLAWVFTASMIIKVIVYEKETRLKETMSMMGLSNCANRLALFLETLVLMHASIMILIIILAFGRILSYSDPALIYIFLLSFCLSTISFGFFVSVFFSKANIAAAVGGIIYLTTFLPFSLLNLWEDKLTFSMKLASSLLPNVAFGWGSQGLVRREEQGMGVQFSNLYTDIADGDHYTFLHAIMMLLIDSAILFSLAWYLEHVIPGQYGLAQPWYFPVMPDYWAKSDKRQSLPTGESPNMDKKSSLENGMNVEALDGPYGSSVQIRNLWKIFSNGKAAIRDLSLDFYPGITALLGHNGCGKTTLFSLLCGLFSPSSGTVKIYGHDVETDMDHIRETLGVCPQHNVLWNDLTVEEHLQFYASLKMQDRKAIQAEITLMLDKVGLAKKRLERAKNLSGGMQRKLSVAIAYIGGAKFVLLDEPTAGVDPWARRGIWNLLLHFRPDRTTIVSTHFHGEADTLSDRIAIMAEGTVLCCGSPVFLKRRFGSGYHLTLAKTDSATSEPIVGNFLRSLASDVALVDSSVCELSYVISSTAPREEHLALLLERLDSNMKELGVSGYGLRDTSLEEAFLHVLDNFERNQSATEPPSHNAFPEYFINSIFHRLTVAQRKNALAFSQKDIPAKSSFSMEMRSAEFSSAGSADWSQDKSSMIRLTGAELKWQQITALWIKRFHYVRRCKRGFCCEIILPAAFVCLALLINLLSPVATDQPPLQLTPLLYGPPNYIFFAANNYSQDREISDIIKLLFEHPLASKRTRNESTVQSAFSKPFQRLARTPNPVPSGGFGRSISESPCHELKYTTDWICNMTGENISEWLVRTSFQYDGKCYGGFSFGQVDSFGYEPRAKMLDLFDKESSLTVEEDEQTLGFGKTWQDFRRIMPGLFQRDNVKVWFNNRGWASSPSYLNAMNNILLQSKLKDLGFDPSNFGIIAVSHPLNRTANQMEDELSAEGNKVLLLAVCVIFALSFVPASFVMFLIEERVIGAKNLQFMAGVKPWLYWSASYVWDIGNYLVTAVLCLGIFLIFNEQAYVSAEAIPMLICLLAMYGFATIPLMYIASFYFKVASSAFVALSCANLFLGLGFTVTIYMLESFRDQAAFQDLAAVLRQVFLISPHYCLGRGLTEMSAMHLKKSIYAKFQQETRDSPFEWNFDGRNISALAVQGVVFFLLTLLIEYNIFWKKKTAPFLREVSMGTGDEDCDVAEERKRIESGLAKHCVLKVQNLTKVFKNRAGIKIAVNGINFAVGKGECFGLLGENGAGKSTTFKMLTENLTPTSGDATINGHSVVTDRDNSRKYMGYCPQFDAINPLLTGREHLQFYARIHGTPKSHLKKTVDQAIKHMQLVNFADSRAGVYSGGNKRKLSTAIALIGDPDLVFLDEPTTGMDPKARRFLWNCVLNMRRAGRSVVITSHSLEECEILCTKLAIMANGQLQCIGSQQHLKSRFGTGYSVTLRCSPETIEKVCWFMETTFPAARLQNRHYNTVQYCLPQHCVKLSEVFHAIEQNRELLQIEESSVNQANLEDIFLQFARKTRRSLDEDLNPEETSEGN